MKYLLLLLISVCAYAEPEKNLNTVVNEIEPTVLLKSFQDETINNLKIQEIKIEAIKDRVEDINGSIDRFGILVTFFSVLVTAIVIYFSFKNTSEAKSVAQDEIQKWLSDKGEDFVQKEVEPIKLSLNETVILLKKEIIELQNKSREEIEELKFQLNEKGNEVLDNLSSKISENSITEDDLSFVDKQYFESQIKAIRYKPTNKRTFQDYKKMTLFYIASKNFKKADLLFKRLSDNNFNIQERAWLHYIRGISLYKQYSELHNPNKHLYNDALAYFDRAIELYPSLIQAYTAKAKIFNVIKQQYDEASMIAKNALEIDSYSYDAYISLGYAARNKAYFENQPKLYDLAISYNEKAININPDLELAYNNIGSIYKMKYEYEKALIWYNKSIDVNPNEWVYINIFMMHLVLDRSFPKLIENEYTKNFTIEKSCYLVIYELLIILKELKKEKVKSTKRAKILINAWTKKFKKKRIRYFSFRPLSHWVESEDDDQVKSNLEYALSIFKKNRVKEESWRR